MCSMMCSARAECRRGDGERRAGERERNDAAKIQFPSKMELSQRRRAGGGDLALTAAEQTNTAGKENKGRETGSAERKRTYVQYGVQSAGEAMVKEGERKRGMMVKEGEGKKETTEKQTAAKINFSYRKWSSHSGLEKEIWRSQRPRGGEMEQF